MPYYVNSHNLLYSINNLLSRPKQTTQQALVQDAELLQCKSMQSFIKVYPTAVNPLYFVGRRLKLLQMHDHPLTIQPL